MGNSFDGRIPHPLGKKRAQNPTPGPIKKVKIPPRGIFLNHSLQKSSKTASNKQRRIFITHAHPFQKDFQLLVNSGAN